MSIRMFWLPVLLGVLGLLSTSVRAADAVALPDDEEAILSLVKVKIAASPALRAELAKVLGQAQKDAASGWEELAKYQAKEIQAIKSTIDAEGQLKGSLEALAVEVSSRFARFVGQNQYRIVMDEIIGKSPPEFRTEAKRILESGSGFPPPPPPPPLAQVTIQNDCPYSVSMMIDRKLVSVGPGGPYNFPVQVGQGGSKVPVHTLTEGHREWNLMPGQTVKITVRPDYFSTQVRLSNPQGGSYQAFRPLSGP